MIRALTLDNLLTPEVHCYRNLLAFFGFDLQVKGVEGGQICGFPAETEACTCSFVFVSLIGGHDGRDQDWKVAHTECNTILDGA